MVAIVANAVSILAGALSAVYWWRSAAGSFDLLNTPMEALAEIMRRQSRLSAIAAKWAVVAVIGQVVVASIALLAKRTLNVNG